MKRFYFVWIIIAAIVFASGAVFVVSSSPSSTNHKTNNNNDDDNIQVKKTPNDYLVVGIEDIGPAYKEFDGKMYAGTVHIENGKKRVGETMFWLFEPTTQSIPDTFIVWLNGGPGCSSFNCGIMMEHSPVTQPLHDAGYCCVDDEYPKLQYNNHTWTRSTSVLYVEHPIGTGFSYGNSNPETEYEASADFYIFLQNFLNVFTQFQSYSFYVIGESYAGMFVPAIAHYIHYKNEKNSKTKSNDPNNDKIINLKGAAIGNGWMNAYVQGPTVIDYSYWHGLIDLPTRNALQQTWKKCSTSRKKTSIMQPPFHSFNVQDDCGMMWGVLEAAGQPNAYDITTWDPNVDQITFTTELFFNNPQVKKVLHAPMNITWHGCQEGSGRRRRRRRRQLATSMNDHDQTNDYHRHRRLYMDNDKPINVVPYVAELLDAGIHIVIYNGDRDMTTNMVGTELALNEMKWSGQREWLNADRGLWMVDNYQAGWAKEYKSLSFVVVYNSGHMVPYNQPKPAFDLLNRLLLQKSFIDNVLPQIRVTEGEGSIISADGLDDSGSSNYKGYFITAILFFLLGVIFTFIISHIYRGVWKKRGHGYRKVPDAEISLVSE